MVNIKGIKRNGYFIYNIRNNIMRVNDKIN
jgi:hypothetical protein